MRLAASGHVGRPSGALIKSRPDARNKLRNTSLLDRLEQLATIRNGRPQFEIGTAIAVSAGKTRQGSTGQHLDLERRRQGEGWPGFVKIRHIRSKVLI